ncbi:hypothetical protein SAMN05192576_2225 [Nocardioides szechwanensis]|uniref:Uncharacterized protein n=1 Tax=Nocardioides szechwanensis TaxID=1005944 RepID=A0A1H0BTC2_9ACTN|nr:hypothetical protein SAMN05192576_2225 [Nocardioides szechwanensis]
MAIRRAAKYSRGMATKRDNREASIAAPVKVADREKVREISKKIRKRDAELLKRLAR